MSSEHLQTYCPSAAQLLSEEPMAEQSYQHTAEEWVEALQAARWELGRIPVQHCAGVTNLGRECGSWAMPFGTGNCWQHSAGSEREHNAEMQDKAEKLAKQLLDTGLSVIPSGQWRTIAMELAHALNSTIHDDFEVPGLSDEALLVLEQSLTARQVEEVNQDLISDDEELERALQATLDENPPEPVLPTTLCLRCEAEIISYPIEDVELLCKDCSPTGRLLRVDITMGEIRAVQGEDGHEFRMTLVACQDCNQAMGWSGTSISVADRWAISHMERVDHRVDVSVHQFVS